jgi:hypothetical protein
VRKPATTFEAGLRSLLFETDLEPLVREVAVF